MVGHQICFHNILVEFISFYARPDLLINRFCAANLKWISFLPHRFIGFAAFQSHDKEQLN